MITDCHTHHPRPGAIVNIDPSQPVAMDNHLLYSVGIHPWNSDAVTREDLERLNELARLDNVVAIGETGIDTLRGAAVEKQKGLFDCHIELSEALAKPLIIHAVKAFPLIIAAQKKHDPSMPWIIHGFRGKPQLAEELLRHGFYLSIGAKFNPASLCVIPPDRLLIETDDSMLPITEIAARAGIDPAETANLF